MKRTPEAGSILRRALELPALAQAWSQVAEKKGCAGADGVSICRFARHWEEHLRALRREVLAGTYRPHRLRTFFIRKRSGGRRRLGVPAVRDRVLQRAVLNELEPFFERIFLPNSYGYRPGRGVRQAVQEIVRVRDAGRRYVLDADIDAFFDNVDHEVLLGQLAGYLDDAALLHLIAMWIRASPSPDYPVRKGPERSAERPARTALRKGLPQGAVISPLLANIYLHPLDLALTRHGLALVRYADDFVVLCRDEAELQRALALTEAALAELHLVLDAEDTFLTHFDAGFDFLGVHFQGNTFSFQVSEKRVEVEGEVPDILQQYVPEGYI